jgi:hypothetical protein
MVCDFLDCAERLPSILGIVNMRNFPAIDPQVAFSPRRNVDFQPIVTQQRDKLLNCCPFSDGQCLIGLPFEGS